MRSNMKRAVRGSAQRAQHISLSSKKSRSTVGDAGKSATHGEGILSAAPVEGLQNSSASISTTSATAFQDYTSDTLSIGPSIAPTHGSADWMGDAREAMALSVSGFDAATGSNNHTRRFRGQARHKNLHIPGFLKSRDFLSSSSRESMNTASDLQKVDNGPAETQILLMGSSKRTTMFLQRSMKLAYGHNYTKASKEAFRISILHNVVQNMRSLLFSMRDLGIPLQNSSSESHAHSILTKPVTPDWQYLPPDVSIAIAVLWRDPGVVDALHRRDTHSNWDDPE